MRSFCAAATRARVMPLRSMPSLSIKPSRSRHGIPNCLQILGTVSISPEAIAASAVRSRGETRLAVDGAKAITFVLEISVYPSLRQLGAYQQFPPWDR